MNELTTTTQVNSVPVAEDNTDYYDGLKLVSSDVVDSIKSASDNGVELTKLVLPSEINDFMSTSLQNIELEEVMFAICSYARLNGDTFGDIEIDDIQVSGNPLSSYQDRLDTLEAKGYIYKSIQDTGTLSRLGIYSVTNIFIKAFSENGIFDLEKAKLRRIEREKNLELRASEEKIKQGIYDQVMIIHTWVNSLSEGEIFNYDSLRVLIEEKSASQLTLGKFDGEQRGCIDVFIKVKGVTFETNPFMNNISIGYMRGRSEDSINDSCSRFLSWLIDTPKEQFEDNVRDDLKLKTINQLKSLK